MTTNEARTGEVTDDAAIGTPPDRASGRTATSWRSGSRAVLWISWAVLFVLTAAWAVANPLMASPDEPAHVVKAAAVVRGQWTGTDVDGGTLVEVPYYYNLTTGYPVCYMFRPDVTAVCDPVAVKDLDTVGDAVTPAGRYNPLYYLLVGAPTLLPSGDGVLYAMRLLSAALCTFFLALGLRAMAESSRPSWAVLGAVGAVTPMVVFLSSTVNPAAIEIAAAFSLWCQLLTLLRHPDPAVLTRRMAWIAVTAVVLVNSRGLSLLYTALLVGAVLLVSPWQTFLQVVRTRSTWPWFGVIAVGGLAAVVWLLASDSLGAGTSGADTGLSFREAAVITLGATDLYVTNMIGQFGWMDADLMTWAHMLFAAVVGIVVLLALAVARRREQLGILLIAAATLAVPIAVQGSQAASLGIIWQGRYMLPVAVGVPLVAAYCTVTQPSNLPRDLGRRLARLTALIASALLFVAFVINLHRYVNGVMGPWLSLAPDAWVPPLPIPVVLVLGLVGSAAYVLLVIWISRSAGAAGTAPGTTRPPAVTAVPTLERRG